MLHPANDYVAEFTKHIPRAKVIKVRTLMQPLATSDHAGDVPASARVAEVADRIEAAALPFRVLDENGTPIGEIHRKAVIDVLIGRGQ